MGVVNTEGVIAHMIFAEWVVRFVMQQCYCASVPSRASVPTWEVVYPSTEQVKHLVCENMATDGNLLCLYIANVCV